MTTHLILTVGTGTAGKHSNLTQGLINTVRQSQPDRYWLVPSTSPDSLAVADLIRSEAPQGFEFWAPEQPYRSIEHPDDIYECRATVGEVIRLAVERGGGRARILVNPTSGTKQMSAGATLAALDNEVGDLVFTVGERIDGVVKTGTERLVDFSTQAFFEERDLRSARYLHAAGSFAAAGALLRRQTGAKSLRARHVALCRHAWHRFDYAKAASEAATIHAETSHAMHRCGVMAREGTYATELLADIIAGADELRGWQEPDDALIRYVKALEYAGRMCLAKNLNIHGAMPYDAVPDLNLPKRIAERLYENADGSCTPGLSLVMQIMHHIGDPMAIAFWNDRGLSAAVTARNDAVHDLAPVRDAEAQSLADRLRNLLLRCIDGLADAIATARRLRADLDACWPAGGA